MTARIAGIRPPPTSSRWDGGRLRFADAGSLALAPGDWVVVDGDDGIRSEPGDAGGVGPARSDDRAGQAASEPWVGEVVVAPEQVVEAAPLGALPRVLCLARHDERPPARAEGAGLHLLRSLGLPEPATHPGPTRPASAAAASPDDHRPDQQDDRQQPGPDPAPPQR